MILSVLLFPVVLVLGQGQKCDHDDGGARKCETNEDCPKSGPCGAAVCFDFGFMKGCTFCSDMGIEDDCTHESMNDMCIWKQVEGKDGECHLRQAACKKEAETCASDDECCKGKNGPGFCFDYGFSKGCTHCESVEDADACKEMESNGCMFDAENKKCMFKKQRGDQMCCKALTAQCMACMANQSVEEFCKTEKGMKIQGCDRDGKACCKALTAQCMACAANMSVEDFCKSKGGKYKGCPGAGDGGDEGEKECKTEAKVCEQHSDCCKNDKGMQMMCFDFGGVKACSGCRALGVEKDCLSDQMKGMCKWAAEKEECYAAKGDMEMGDCEKEGMCCPEHFTCKLNRGQTKKACVADNDAEVAAIKCGNPCVGIISNMTQKCGMAKGKAECMAMKNPFSQKQICKWTGDAKDDGKMCCKALTAECMACAANMSVEEYCKTEKGMKTKGCGDDKDDGKMCCKALTAQCMACAANLSVEEFCKTEKGMKVKGCGDMKGDDKDEMCKKEADTCKEGECCQPMVCFDFGFQMGCASCKSHGVADDCTHGDMKDMCVWDDKNEKCMRAPFKNFEEFKDAARKAKGDGCKAFQGKLDKKNKCRPPKKAKKVKCKNFASSPDMCTRLGCTFNGKKKKCSGKPKNIMK